MNTIPHDPRRADLPHAALDRYRNAAAVTVAALGLLVLAGYWALGQDPLQRLFPGLIAMRPNSAAELLLAGASLWLSDKSAPAARRASRLLGALIALWGAASVTQNITGVDLGIDRLLFGGLPTATPHPGRMSLLTATSFLLLGAALAFPGIAAEWLALASLLPLLFSAASCLYGVSHLPDFLAPTCLPWHAAFCVFLLASGVLARYPARKVPRTLLGRGPVATLLRQVLPAALFMLFVAAFLTERAHRVGLLEGDVRCALNLFLSSLALVGLLFVASGTLAKSEDARRQSEEQFRAFVMATSDVVYSMSPDWNEMRHLAGREFIADTSDPSRGWLDRYIPPDEQPVVLAAIGEAIGTRSVFELTHRVIQVDGSLGWVFSRAIPIFGADGEITQWFGAARDVTEQEKTLERLKQSEQLYFAMFEKNQAIKLLIDPLTGAIVDANSAAADFYGYPQAQLKSMHIADLNPLPAAEIRKVLDSVASQPSYYNFIHRLADGSLREVEAFCNPITFDGRVLLHAIVNDISERREALRRLTESEERYRLLCHYQDSLLEKERTSISRTIHDEIGQGLTALKLDLGWIRRKLSPELSEGPTYELIDDMKLRTDQLIGKVQNISAELRSPVLETLGVTAAVECLAQEFKRQTGVLLQLSIDPDCAGLDRERSLVIFRILQEALTNIARHAGATGVSLSLAKLDGVVLLTVADNGRGIAQRDLSRPTSFGIMGMRERAAACNGRLQISGFPDGGTTLMFELPLGEGGVT
jgi:PAS domain S-box-containing protein